MHGFELAEREFKTAAYADDLLFFLTQPHLSISNLLEDFKMFGYISNLKVNYNKSGMLNISLSEEMLKLTCQACSFKWEEEKKKIRKSPEILGHLAYPQPKRPVWSKLLPFI